MGSLSALLLCTMSYGRHALVSLVLILQESDHTDPIGVHIKPPPLLRAWSSSAEHGPRPDTWLPTGAGV
jgi:hypothetical protein